MGDASEEKCELHPQGGCICHQYRNAPLVTYGDRVHVLNPPFTVYPGQGVPVQTVDVAVLQRRVEELEEQVKKLTEEVELMVKYG